MLRMQINSKDYGGLGVVAAACRIEQRAEPLCKSPNNQQQLPLLRQSRPEINKPPNSTHATAATCRPVNSTESTLSSEGASIAKTSLHFLRISNHDQVYGSSLQVTTRV